MNRLVAILGSVAFAAALVLGGYAIAQTTLVVAPISASLAVQQDGTCRGHVVYAIAPGDNAIADDLGVVQGTIEVKTPCARLATIATGETYDSKGGKLSISVNGADIVVVPTDPDGTGPRAAGECDVMVRANVRVLAADLAKVFPPREVVRTRADATCSTMTGLIDRSCWIARGSWPAAAPFPSIPKCP